MSAPIVNDYKKQFIFRRLLETYSGGLRIYFTSSVPLFVYFIQIAMFAFIPCSCGIFLHLVNRDIIKMVPAALANGCTTILYSLFIQILAFFLQKQKLPKDFEQVESFGDEESYEFDSVFGPKTWHFLIPPKKLLGCLFIHSLVAGALGGLAIYYLHLEPKEFLKSNALKSIFTFLGLVTTSVGIWPLIVGSPPEIAVFHQLPYDLQNFSRPCHMLTCIIINGISSLHPNVLWLFYTNCVFHAIYAFSSFLWLIGALPPIDAYIIWALEQWLVLFLGGSPTSSNKKLVFYTVIGTLNLIILFHLPNLLALTIYSSITGFILSLDLGTMLSFLRRHRIQSAPPPNPPPPPDSPSDRSSFVQKGRRKCNVKQDIYIYGIFLVGILALVLGLSLSNYNWFLQSWNLQNNTFINETLSEEPQIPALFQTKMLNILWGCLMFLSISLLTLHQIQKPFVLLLVRNHLCQAVKKLGQKPLLMASYFIHCGGPLVCFLFIHVLLAANILQVSFGENVSESFCLALSYGFLFRQIWQNPEHNIICLFLYMTIEKIGGTSLQNSSWGSLKTATRVHLFNLFCFWLRGTLKRLEVIFMFSWTSVTESKQRKLINFILVGLNVALAPLLVLMAFFCSVLSFPLFPLFTLPCFLIGFPRPLRFWSYPVGYTSNFCSDTIYYEQIMPYVTKALHQGIRSSSLGVIYPGEMFLLRWEDRFFIVQILEVGFCYVTYCFKGLELQETSCHTAEACRVDSIFSRAFDSAFYDSWFNSFPLHTLTPLTKICIPVYSDTRNVLTGVIDSPETLFIIKDYFLKSLVYFLLNYARICNGKKPFTSRSKPVVDTNVSRLGSSSAITRQVFSNLPKDERTNESRPVSANTPIPDEERSPSIKSQSGRGSRLAWVGEKSVMGPITKSDGKPPLLKRESIIEEGPINCFELRDERNEKGRPILLRKESKEFASGFSLREHSTEHLNVRQLKVKPIKAKNYAKPLTIPGNSTPQNYGSPRIKDLISDSDSDSDSIQKFLVRSIPQKSKLKEEDAEKLKNKERHSSKTKTSLISEKSISPIKDTYIQESDIKPPPKVNPRTRCDNYMLAYKSALSVTLSPQLSWIVKLPFDEETLEDFQDEFPLSWFKFLLKHFAIEELEELKPTENETELSAHDERLIQQLLCDEFLEESYRTLVALCHVTIFGTDFCLPTTNQVYKLFHGEFTNSRGVDWLKSKENLLEIVLKSYRIAVKLSLDHVLVGPINNCWSDLEAALSEYNDDWYVGPDKCKNINPNVCNDATWDQAIKKEIPNLFSLGYNEMKGQYTSHLLTLGDTEINVGKLEDEVVRSIWVSLSGELLYFTNDDDERYSIQAHSVLLRNLTIQAADPPLGYPIYSSQPVSHGLT